MKAEELLEYLIPDYKSELSKDQIDNALGAIKLYAVLQLAKQHLLIDLKKIIME